MGREGRNTVNRTRRRRRNIVNRQHGAAIYSVYTLSAAAPSATQAREGSRGHRSSSGEAFWRFLSMRTAPAPTAGSARACKLCARGCRTRLLCPCGASWALCVRSFMDARARHTIVRFRCSPCFANPKFSQELNQEYARLYEDCSASQFPVNGDDVLPRSPPFRSRASNNSAAHRRSNVVRVPFAATSLKMRSGQA